MKQHSVQGRPWDSFDAYLFDIDGTLLTCTDAVHYFAFLHALQTLSGQNLTLEGVTAHGNTDIGILRDAMTLAGVDEEHWRPGIPVACQAMEHFVEQRVDQLRIRSLPAVEKVLTHLRAQGAVLGIATGNLRGIGTLKLKAAGLLGYFTVGGWSDGLEYRVDVFRNAATSLRIATSPHAAICVVGDTPADISAAHRNALPVVALCTGVYSRQQLLESKPDLCLDSLAELVQA